MPDTVTTTDQTSPSDAGHTTTEFYVAKIVTVLSAVSAALGLGMDILGKLQGLVPAAPWLNTTLVVGGIVAAVVSQVIYTLSRVQIKKALIDADVKKSVVIPFPQNVKEAASVIDAAA